MAMNALRDAAWRNRLADVGKIGIPRALDACRTAPPDLLEERLLLRRIDRKYVLPARLLDPLFEALTRDYSFDETALLAKQRERDTLSDALAGELASVLMRRLASLK